MEKLKLIYEGKSKNIYQTDIADFFLCEFKDAATAGDGAKKGVIKKKGFYNANISTKIFQLLESKGIPTHFVKLFDDHTMVIKKLKMVPVEMVVRRKVAGSMAKALGMEEGTELKLPVLDMYLKNDSLHDPKISEDYIKALDIAPVDVIDRMKELTWEVTSILDDFFTGIGIDLIDFKLEFGLDKEGHVVLGDEITPDGCRLWDIKTGEKLDKDRFRRNLGKVEEAYQEVHKRVTSAK